MKRNELFELFRQSSLHSGLSFDMLCTCHEPSLQKLLFPQSLAYDAHSHFQIEARSNMCLLTLAADGAYTSSTTSRNLQCVRIVSWLVASTPIHPYPPLSIMIHHCSSQCLCSLIIRTANYEWVSFGDWCLDQDMSALMTALIDSILDVVSAQSTWPMLVRSPDDIGHQWAQIAILKNQPYFLRRRSLGQHPYFLFFESVQRQADFPHLGLPLVGW